MHPAKGGAGCGGSARIGATATEGPLEVQVSQLFITVTNRSTGPLTDVEIILVPFGHMEFSAQHARLEPGQRRHFAYNQLRSQDGSRFNLRLYRPRTIRVTAVDYQKMPHEVELPWR